MLFKVIYLLARLPDEKLILGILRNACSVNNAHISAQLDSLGRAKCYDPVIVPWLAMMRDLDVMKAVGSWYSSGDPEPADLGFFLGDSMLDLRKPAITETQTEQQPQPQTESQQTSEPIEHQGQSKAPAKPFTVQKFQLVKGGKTALLEARSAYRFTNNTRIAMWSVAAMFDDFDHKLRFTAGAKILEILMDEDNYEDDVEDPVAGTSSGLEVAGQDGSKLESEDSKMDDG